MSIQRDSLARPLHKPQEQKQNQYAPKPQTSSRNPQQKAAAREKLRWLGTIVVCIVLALCVVARYAGMVSLNYQIEEKKADLQKMQDEQLSLEKQVLELESPDRIKGFATNKLGMTQVDDGQLIVVEGK
jgi:cell division protein FtsL